MIGDIINIIRGSSTSVSSDRGYNKYNKGIFYLSIE